MILSKERGCVRLAFEKRSMTAAENKLLATALFLLRQDPRDDVFIGGTEQIKKYIAEYEKQGF